MFVKKFSMSGHHTLQVKEIQRLTDDAVAISFSIPKELRQPFSFKAGQYLNLFTINIKTQGKVLMVNKLDDPIRFVVRHTKRF